MAYGAVQSLGRRGTVVEVLLRGLTGGRESGSAIGRGTKWSVGGEAVWRGWGGRAPERSIGGTRQGPYGGAKETGLEGETDGLTALSRNGSPCERGTDGGAGQDGAREQAPAVELRYKATTSMRGDRGRVWPVAQRSGNTLPQQTGANADGCLLDARKALRVGAD
mgnify:CR=1 FL=1